MFVQKLEAELEAENLIHTLNITLKLVSYTNN
jgi:hypothetical protein